MKVEKNTYSEEDLNDYDHFSSNLKTPLRDDAFDLSDKEKIEIIKSKVADIIQTLGLDLTDDSIKGTPKRVAEMYVNEIFSGLNPKTKPKASTLKTTISMKCSLRKILLFSQLVEHTAIIGKAHVGYISNGTVVGLSKMNRIVQYYSQRPQVQRLTLQIVEEMQNVLRTKDVACVIDAKHICINSRGVCDQIRVP